MVTTVPSPDRDDQPTFASAPLDAASARVGQIVVGLLELTNAFDDAIELAGADEIKSNADVTVLVTLRLDGPQRPRDLIVPTSLTSGGMTNLIDRLSGVGLVRRRRGGDRDDRRAVLVELTPEGVEMLDRLARSVGSTLRLAAPLLERWRRLFVEMGIEVGPVPSRAAGSRHELERLRRLGAAGRRGFLTLSRMTGPDDPAPNHTIHLLWLAAGPNGTRPRSIGEATRLSSASTTDLLDRCEGRGLIVRMSDASDGRAVVVRPTTAGRALLDETLDEMRQHLPELAAAFLPS